MGVRERALLLGGGLGGQPVEDLWLGRLEDAVKATQHDERKDHAPVLGLLVVPSEEVCDRPDRARVVVDLGRDRQFSRSMRSAGRSQPLAGYSRRLSST